MRVLLVEDDPRLAALIAEGLRDDGLMVDHAPNAAIGRGMAELETYDLLILDVMLPEGPQAGFELARVLRGRRDKTPILFLTARGDVDSKLTGLDSGGDDYLSKPFDFRELRARIRALVRRARGEATNLIPLPRGYTLDLAAHQVLKDGQPVPLTPREYALVECFGLNPGRAYSRNSLIERVWPGESEVDTKVVDVYVSSLRRKLGEDFIETVRGLGYRLGRVEEGP
ncbi:MAG: response regulator transcription factor [Meiothermus sp.]|uniref:response regulator transcription factor n=1 Tax=Meiothermus sp. TaxID=1955249 RepID=UPI0025CBB249|nr:response regulator transcription factor [Meiothermus sp.]MCS7195576.1 response regulator transcription factor [Meiothermus sp.]MCX7739572.1 response regulator transcription factor [Meiothermus sp.]MDW8091937.1 response regulator transcription factor [Meiothermus sp.]